MNKTAFAIGLGASLLFAAGAANAGTCTAEIDQLQQSLGMDSSSSTSTQAQTGVQQPSPIGAPIDLSTGAPSTDATTDTTTGATANAADPSGKSGVQQPDPGVEADANASAAAQAQTGVQSGSSTMPAPTVAETSRSGQLNVDVNTRTQALVSIEKARSLDQAGEEDACMAEIGNAKQLLGIH